MKQILLIDREFGAGGSCLAEKLAARLNWKLFDQALTEEIARRTKMPIPDCHRREGRVDPWLHRLVNLIWRGSIGRNLPSPDLAVLDTDCLVREIQKAVEQAAEARPCVIVGRGAPHFLRSRKDTFSVFLYAPRELKYRRVLKRVGNEKEAVELVDSMDDDRRKFVKHYFSHEWPNRQLFHAMLNTCIGDEVTVETILNLLNAANREGEASKR